MNKRLNKTQRNYIIIGLCAILVIMGVGYAAFQSQLRISGTSNIASNFLVRITGIRVSSQSGGAADKPEVTTYTDTTATFGTTLQSPGDTITYDITIENQGSIDATLKTISKTDASNSAIIFETSGVNEGDPLNVGEIATMQVTVTYNPSVISQPTNLESTLNVTLDYEQSEGIVTPPTPSGMTPEDLKALAVTEGDGLYADEYEAGKYTYKGANPNNYITFNNETWRIISIDPDGTLKILRDELLSEERVFDSVGARTTGYCATVGNRGCNAWSSTINMVGSPTEFTTDTISGNVNADSEMLTYLNSEYLNTLINTSSIVSHTWNIGAVVYNGDEINNLSLQIASEKEYQWNGQIGLISSSEYIRSNTNSESCETISGVIYNYDICPTTNWMLTSDNDWWTLTPFADGPSSVWGIFSNVYHGIVSEIVANDPGGVRPALYLSSDITLIGDGTQGNPYVIT